MIGHGADDIVPALRRHRDRYGLSMVVVTELDEISCATRLDPDDAWVRFTARSIERTSKRRPVILPNLGETTPNDILANVLGVRTMRVPHSYPGCSQHNPDDHLPVQDIQRDGLRVMTGIFWDLGDLREEGQSAMLPGCDSSLWESRDAQASLPVHRERLMRLICQQMLGLIKQGFITRRTAQPVEAAMASVRKEDTARLQPAPYVRPSHRPQRSCSKGMIQLFEKAQAGSALV